jgi:LysR family transcriptional regulator, carnitine catabolism transcriptional activator
MMGQRLTLVHMRAVREVARRGNFTAAARHLQMSQSALTRTIQEAERVTRVSLFSRSTRNVSVTPSGAELVAAVEDVLAVLDDRLAAFEAFTRVERGILALSTLPSVAAALLPAILRSIGEGHSGLGVVTLDGPADDVAAHLLNGDAEIALTACVGDDRMQEAPMIEEDFFAVAAPGVWPPSDEPITWERLVSHELVTTRVGTSIRTMVDGVLEPMGERVSGHLQASTVATVGGLVRSGLGVAALPTMEIEGYGLSDLEVRQLVKPKLVRRLGLVYPTDHQLSPAAELFVSMTRSILSLTALPPGARFIG